MESVPNPELQLAFEFVQSTNRHIFLTGKAGTGKTTFLHTLKKISPKRMIVVAPTGVAAINAAGVTIHSFFQLPFHPHIPSLYIADTATAVPPGQENTPGYKINRDKINIIKTLDLLVIDEISMVRADLLDAVDAVLRRFKDKSRPFGGVQLLMIGDLQQLAPVVKNEDRALLDPYYQTTFFFGSHALRSTDYVTIELKHIYRQRDQRFIDLLNNVREGRLDTQTLAGLNERFDPNIGDGIREGYITLTTHNAQALAINDAKLTRISGAPRSFNADITGDFPEYAYPAPSELLLKTGAQVMFVRNDMSREKRFFNGKIGTIIRFEDDAVMVKCPNDDSPITVERVVWENVKYAINAETKNIEERIAGTFTQYPLRLAWAITIHKSQGLTFDKAIIDARAAFAHGQVYVALSRCRTLEGLILSSQIQPRGVISDSTVNGFVRDAEKRQPGRDELNASKTAYQQALLSELLDFTPITRAIQYGMRIMGEHRTSFAADPLEALASILALVNTGLIAISARFQPQIRQLLAADANTQTNAPLQERIMKAGGYFGEKITSVILPALDGITIETDNSTAGKSATQSLERIRKEAVEKSFCLASIGRGFSTEAYLEARAKAALAPSRPHARPTAESGNDASNTPHPDLLKQLKQWRYVRADELDLPHYMILPQKTVAALANALPSTVAQLRKIKGMGKKKIEQFGTELLALIDRYCTESSIERAIAQTDDDDAGEPVKVKVNTKLESLKLFTEGKTIDEVAKERYMALSTIEGHLAHYVGTGELPVERFVSPEIVTLITDHIKAQGDSHMGPIKEALGEKASWGDIRFVMKHLECAGVVKVSTLS